MLDLARRIKCQVFARAARSATKIPGMAAITPNWGSFRQGEETASFQKLYLKESSTRIELNQSPLILEFELNSKKLQDIEYEPFKGTSDS